MTEYLTAESQIIPYMAFPRFLLEMDLPETAKIIYIMLLDRARMSLRKPGWVDEDGHLFVYYSVSDLAKDLKKSEMTIKNNLSALEETDLIFRQRSKPGLPSRTYVKVSVHSDSFLSQRETDNFPSEVQKTFSHTDRNLSANKNHMLDMPSAVWTGKCWRDENGFDYICDSVRGILKCPRRVGIVSQGLITARTEAAELLKQLKYECVILDEAHRARRKNIGKDADKYRAQPNNLLRFLDEITFQTQSMLLATATPVQIHPIEAFDLLDALGRPKEASKVLGDSYSIWRRKPQTGLDYMSQSQDPPDTEAEMWEIVRNPFPPRTDSSRRVGTLRNQMDIPDDVAVLPQDRFKSLRRSIQNKVWELYQDEEFLINHNPYVRGIVRRTRDFL